MSIRPGVSHETPADIRRRVGDPETAPLHNVGMVCQHALSHVQTAGRQIVQCQGVAVSTRRVPRGPCLLLSRAAVLPSTARARGPATLTLPCT